MNQELLSDERLAELIRYFELRDPSTSHALASDTEKALTELQSRRSQPYGEPVSLVGFEVKPLSWIEVDPSSKDGQIGLVVKAETPMGVYYVERARLPAFLGKFQFWHVGIWDRLHLQHSDTAEEAKAAAEADYEQRIRSAIEPACITITDEMVERGAQALAWVEDMPLNNLMVAHARAVLTAALEVK